MSATGRSRSRFRAVTSLRVSRRVMSSRCTPSASAASIWLRKTGAGGPRRATVAGRAIGSGRVEEAVLAGHPDETGLAGVLGGAGALVGGGLGDFLVRGRIRDLAVMLHRPAGLVAYYGEDGSLGGIAHVVLLRAAWLAPGPLRRWDVS